MKKNMKEEEELAISKYFVVFGEIQKKKKKKERKQYEHSIKIFKYEFRTSE